MLVFGGVGADLGAVGKKLLCKKQPKGRGWVLPWGEPGSTSVRALLSPRHSTGHPWGGSGSLRATLGTAWLDKTSHRQGDGQVIIIIRADPR